MSFRLSFYYQEATKLPATMGAICGGFTGLLAGIGPLLFSSYVPILMARAISAAAISLVCGAVFGALSGGLLGALVAIAIPELDSNK